MGRDARTGFALVLAVAVLLLGGAALYSAYRMQQPLDPRGQPRVVEISSGETLREVRQQLLEEKILSSDAPLLLWARLTGQDRQIRSGFFELSPAQSPREILDTLVAGRVMTVQVTIPEGLSVDRILPRLAEALDVPDDRFAAAATDTAWVRSLDLGVAQLEGYLYPETYRFERGADPHRVLATMIHAGLETWTPRRRRLADSLGMDRHAVLTLASIVEAEAAVIEEMPRIAAVYHNRLRLGWLLQADPTVAYALGRYGQPLWEKDLEVESPYNTYLHPGLPPGPICSPGLRSIDAVLQPLEDCRDLYFVARGDGTHIFSRSLKAHNRAKEEIRRHR